MNDPITSARRVGVLGGSFDPPHAGHVLLATYALSAAPLDAVLVVPAFAHAFGKRSSPFEDRLAMCRLAFTPLDPARVHVSDIERTLPSPSFTYRTLEALEARYPEAALRLIVGSDIVNEIERWANVERIRELAPLCVVGRGGHAGAHDEALSLELPEVSSSELREALRAGVSPRGKLPLSVLEYIEARGLYREEGGAP